MSETATHDTDVTTHDPDSAWLAAYALGLAYSSNGQQEQLELLLDAADGDPELLDHARQRLATTEVADPPLRETAQQLLHHARTVQRTDTGHDHPQATGPASAWS